MMRLITASLSSAFFVSACALHPLPEDVTGVDTYAIVMQIRCEARDAIASEAIAYLRYTKAPDDIIISLKGRPYEIESVLLSSKNKQRLKTEQLETLYKYKNASISMEFSLQMTEDDNLSASAGILSTFLSGSDQIGLSASDNHTRRNLRDFKITENWFDLVQDKKNGCEKYQYKAADYNYPIAGSIGLAEVVDTYARLNEKVNFSNSKQDSADNAFVDDLTFTTAVSGSITPAHMLNTSKGRSIILKNSGGGLTSDRSDQHELIVALFIPKKNSTSKEKSKEISSAAASLQASKRFLFGINPLTSLQDVVPALTR